MARLHREFTPFRPLQLSAWRAWSWKPSIDGNRTDRIAARRSDKPWSMPDTFSDQTRFTVRFCDHCFIGKDCVIFACYCSSTFSVNILPVTLPSTLYLNITIPPIFLFLLSHLPSIVLCKINPSSIPLPPLPFCCCLSLRILLSALQTQTVTKKLNY